MRGYWCNAIDAIGSVVIPQLATHIRVQTLVERTNLFPNNVHILTEVARLIGQVPVLAAIGDIYERMKVSQSLYKYLSDLLTIYVGHLLHDIDELLVVIAHTSPNFAMILYPGVLQLIPVSALGHNVLKVRYIVQIALKGLLIRTDARIIVEKQHLVQQTIVLQGKHYLRLTPSDIGQDLLYPAHLGAAHWVQLPIAALTVDRVDDQRSNLC